MKKIFLLLVFFVSLGGLAIALFNNNKLKASPVYEPNNIYAVEILEWDSPSHQIVFVMYIEESFYLDYTTFGIHTRSYTSVAPYSIITSAYTDLTRNAGYDTDNGYEAYIYVLNNVSSNAIDITFDWSSATLRTKVGNNLYGWGNYYNATQVSYTITNTAYNEGYYNGQQAGYDTGYDRGVDDTLELFEEGAEGYEEIFQEGYSAGLNAYDTMGWFSSVSSGVESILNIHILPSITIGALIFVPFMFMILSGVLWIWRRK